MKTNIFNNMTSFEVGDRVYVTKNATEYARKFEGKTGTVKDIYQRNVRVQLDGEFNRRSGVGLFYFDARGLALIDEKPNIPLSMRFVVPKQVIYNPPATIVYWSDNTKTVVKCAYEDEWDAEKGLAMAIVKRAYGNDNSFHKIFSEWIEPEESYTPKLNINSSDPVSVPVSVIKAMINRVFGVDTDAQYVEKE